MTPMTIDPVTAGETVAAAWVGLRLCHAVADYLVPHVPD
jgi:hypothetical protein